MKSRGSRLMVGVLAASALAGVALAKPAWVRQAKEKGFPAQNCMYCHTDKFPKKDTFKLEELNARGKWLMDEMHKRKAKEIDLSWLKDYPGGKEQK